MRNKKLILTLCFIQTTLTAVVGQTVLLEQKSFAKTVPAGNYSGIVRIEGNRYALVSDKSTTDGFFLFDIDIDSVSGELTRVQNVGFHSSPLKNRDEEGIAFRKTDSTLYICGETDNSILQYRMDGSPTGKSLSLPQELKNACIGNYGLESLTYNDSTSRFWTCNEHGDIIITEFNDSLLPVGTYHYVMAAPRKDSASALYYAHGVSELLALDDGSLLVLEREFYVPHKKIGASVVCRVVKLKPLPYPTQNTMESLADNETRHATYLLCEWKSKLTLFDRSLANYEGMCLGPKLVDGRQTVILVSDSQNQYAGVLKDWFRVLIL